MDFALVKENLEHCEIMQQTKHCYYTKKLQVGNGT